MNWMQRLTGWPTPKAAVMQTPERQVPPVSVARPMGRPSWNAAGLFGNLSSLSRIQEQQNLLLYSQLRQAIPILDSAVAKVKQFVGCPEIEADDPVKMEIEAWMGKVRANYVQTGFVNWFSSWMDDVLCYGRGHSEIVLTGARDDIYTLNLLHPPTIHFRPSDDLVSMNIIQDSRGAAPIVVLNPLLLVNGLHDVRSDDPYGKSLLYSIPFVAEVYTGMIKALASTWNRLGSPSMQVHVQFPTEFDDDEQSTKSNAVMGQVQTQWETAMRSRAKADIVDFFSSASADGDIRVSVVGGGEEGMEFSVPAQALVEQMVAKLGLPPFVFGLHWSTTERMSAVQASLLTQMIHSIRHEVQGELQYLIDLRQRLSGGSTEFKICWPEVTLMDQAETARAELSQEQALMERIENSAELWRLGVYDRFDVAKKLRPDLANLPNERIAQLLPDLATEPPEKMEPRAALGPGGQPMAGSDNRPPQRPTGPQNGNGRARKFPDGVLPSVEIRVNADACPICQPYEGRIVAMDDTENLPPYHPNCECFYDIVETQMSNGHRRERVG